MIESGELPVILNTGVVLGQDGQLVLGGETRRTGLWCSGRPLPSVETPSSTCQVSALYMAARLFP